MNNEEYKKGKNLYEDLVEGYINDKLHNLIKGEKSINNIDYIINRLKENVYDSYLNQLSYKAFDDIAINTKDDYGIYVLIKNNNDNKIYRNLETLVDIIIKKEQNNDFITNNKVIIPIYNNESNLTFFNNIRNDFFRILTYNSENESVKKILKRKK